MNVFELFSRKKAVFQCFFLPKLVCATAIIQGAPKRPDTFESLIKIKPVDENRKCSHFWKAYSMPFCVEYAKHEHYIL